MQILKETKAYRSDRSQEQANREGRFVNGLRSGQGRGKEACGETEVSPEKRVQDAVRTAGTADESGRCIWNGGEGGCKKLKIFQLIMLYTRKQQDLEAFSSSFSDF